MVDNDTESIAFSTDHQTIQGSTEPFEALFQPERLKQAENSFEAYLALINSDRYPNSVDELSDDLVLPTELSNHLNSLTIASLDDQHERQQIIGWDPVQKDFLLGKVATGSEKSVTLSISENLKTTRFARERPVIDFHTHPSDAGYSTFFSATDMSHVFSARSPAYITMVGTPEGGYALLSTAQLKRKRMMENFTFTHGLNTDIHDSNYLTSVARQLQESGVVSYAWSNSDRGANNGFLLKKMVTE